LADNRKIGGLGKNLDFIFHHFSKGYAVQNAVEFVIDPASFFLQLLSVTQANTPVLDSPSITC